MTACFIRTSSLCSLLSITAGVKPAGMVARARKSYVASEERLSSNP